MYPPQCDYRRAGSVGEAVDLLADHGDAALLAGGQGLVTDMKTGAAAPGTLVDIGDIEGLRGVVAEDGTVAVGALTRHADLAASGPLREHARVLAEAAAAVGDRQVRNRGTIGGNLAEADPAADLPAAVLAADGTLVVEGPDGERTVEAGEFFHGDGETALGEGELLTGVRLRGGDAGAYVKRTHPARGYALVGVAADATVDDGVVTEARVAATGVADRATRLPAVEDALEGTPADEARVAGAAERATADLADERLVDDHHASGEFRANVLPAYAERALTTAVARAGGERR